MVVKPKSNYTPESDNDNGLNEATSNTTCLIGFQLFSRIVTFIINAIIIRLTSPAILGIATVKLELFYTTLLYQSREGMRMALLRYTRKQESNSDDRWLKGITHMSWLTIPTSILPIGCLLFMYALTIPKELEASSQLIYNYWFGIIILIVAALVELAAEPFHMISIHTKMLKRRLFVESLSLTSRVVVILGFFLVSKNGASSSLSDNLGVALIAFPVGQLVASCVLFIGLHGVIKKSVANFDLFKMIPIPEIEIDETIVKHALDMTKQVFLKYLLTQGDMWIISLMAPLDAQGIYAVVTNYGSLICRILLQPIEEASLVFFSKANPESALDYLYLCLKFHQLFGLMIITFGFTMTKPVINILLSRNWLNTEISIALSAYCFLIPAMAISGVLEAFVNGTMNKDWLGWTRKCSVITTVIYITLAVILTRKLGPTGLVIGNIFNFVIRIGCSSYYISKYRYSRILAKSSKDVGISQATNKRPLKEQLAVKDERYQLRPVTYLGFLLFFAIIIISDSYRSSWSLIHRHSIVVMICGVTAALLVFSAEKPFINKLGHLFGPKNTKHPSTNIKDL